MNMCYTLWNWGSRILEGKFGNCQVDEVLQTIVQGKGTGRLNLEGTSVFGGRVQATFYIEDSRMVRVEVGAGTGYSSLVDLFSLQEGSFSFVGGETAKTKDQSVPVADIVLQVTAARRVEFDTPATRFPGCGVCPAGGRRYEGLDPYQGAVAGDGKTGWQGIDA